MSLIYSLISKGNEKILTDYTEMQGNFETISRTLLKNAKQNFKATFSYEDKYHFHYISQDNLIYMTMCDSSFPSNTAFIFLEAIKNKFTQTYTNNEINNAISYSLNDTFRTNIKYKMDYFNKNKNQDEGVSKLNSGNLEYKEQILQAADILSKKGERVELIVKRAELIRNESKIYFGQSRGARSDIRMRRIRYIFFFVFSIIIIAYFISVISCKGFSWQACRGD